MYPKAYLDQFREFNRTNRIFVAMSFSPDLQPLWESIFRPAIEKVGFEPWRADSHRASDSIHTDILRDIGSARLIIADISSDKHGWRNANVMYEVGVAHASRLPEEVILVRADDDRLPFDFMQIRISRFDPDNPDASKSLIEDLIHSALDEIDVVRDLLIEKTWRILDPGCLLILALEGDQPSFELPLNATAGSYGHLEWAEVRVCMRRLQELGVVEPVLSSHSADQMRQGFKWTALGNVVKTKYASSLAGLRTEY